MENRYGVQGTVHNGVFFTEERISDSSAIRHHGQKKHDWWQLVFTFKRDTQS
jgi:hypothetical protein